MTYRLLRRGLHLIPVLLGTTLVVFAMTAATPGDPVQIMLGDQRATPDQIAALRHDMGLDLLLMLFFSVTLHWFPVSGRTGYADEPAAVTHLLLINSLLAGRPAAFAAALRHLALPAITLALPMAAVLMRVTRAAVIDVLRADYVLFAESKGLSRRRVLLLHVLKNALAPAVSVAALEIGALLGGNMIVETIFAWPGVGRLVVEAIFDRNYPLEQAAVLLYAVVFVVLNSLADILYGVLNPRVGA